MIDRLVYRIPEVCRMLGISRQTFYRHVRTGKIEICRLGPMPVVKRDTLDRLLAERLLREKTETPAAEPASGHILNGRVYFIDDGFFIKIGFSSEPQKRIVKLQTASPFKLTLVASVPGNKRMETDLHKRFRHLKSHGEWFRGESELRQYIRTMRRPEVSDDTAP